MKRRGEGHLSGVPVLMIFGRLPVFLAICLCFCCPLRAGSDDQAWNYLHHVRKFIRSVSMRDGQCLHGENAAVDKDAVTMEFTKGRPPMALSTVVARKADILRISDGPKCRDVLYSGRSSWDDLRCVTVQGYEHLKLVLKSGEVVKGDPAGSNDSSITLLVRRSKVTVDKNQVAQAYYVRTRPSELETDWGYRELGPLRVFDPRGWPYLLNVGVQIPVLLYDSERVEDNSSNGCY